MKRSLATNSALLTLSAAAALALAGCAPSFGSISAPTAGTLTEAQAPALKVAADAGIPLEQPAATAAAAPAAPAAPGAPGAAPAVPGAAASGRPDIFAIAKAMSFGARSNPFALLGSEVSFDRMQTAARIIDETGGFRSDYEPQPDVQEDSVKEQVEVPNWRLAGVIVGDAVVALLDTGSRVVEIRPGSPVPETEWVCIAVDTETAVLRHRRDVQPKEVTIFLAAQLFGAPGVGGQGGPGGGIGDGAGAPGDAGGPGGPPGGSGRRGGGALGDMER